METVGISGKTADVSTSSSKRFQLGRTADVEGVLGAGIPNRLSRQKKPLGSSGITTGCRAMSNFAPNIAVSCREDQ